MHIYFGLGSNLGDRLENLREAVKRLASLGQVVKVSGVYETSAWGGVPHPDYLNACVMIEREEEIAPLELLRIVKDYEVELGRVPSVRWGARKIDIDILLIDDMIYHVDGLDIPHIRIPERKFVLVPLRDIVSVEWRHPESGKSIGEMLADLVEEGEPVKVDSSPQK